MPAEDLGALENPPNPAGTRGPAWGWNRLTYLVGHSRGGTTWLGALLGCHPRARYLFEPFASQAHPCTGIDTQTIFNGGRYIHRGKQGRPVPDIPVKRFRRRPADHPADGLFAALARSHLAAVADQAFPGERGYHLIVKQPRIENVTWAARAIGADAVVGLDRHPFGVVNSVRRWHALGWVRIEWEILSADPGLSPLEQTLAAAATIVEERLLVLSWIRSQHLRSLEAAVPWAVVLDYEDLCRDPLSVTRRIWRQVGLGEEPSAVAALESLLSRREEGADRRSRFLNVYRAPLERVDAWRNELPDSLRRRLEAFVRRHGLDIPLPGAGLPSLSAAERAGAARADLAAVPGRCGRLARRLFGKDRPRAA